VRAVVSSGGRPDLAEVRASVLLIVRSRARRTCSRSSGALDQVVRLAGDWFTAHVTPLAGDPLSPLRTVS
jgi:hypothetical protein